jgi:hypothetical protein
MNVPEEAEKIVKAIKVIREYSGEGMSDCRKALRAANGDPLLAIGYLWATGLCVNVKSDRHTWILLRAQSYSKNLVLGEDGKIHFAEAQQSPRPSSGLKKPIEVENNARNGFC